ncbi:MAG: hypothetical protein ABFD50_11280 [Smithella sp.]
MDDKIKSAFILTALNRYGSRTEKEMKRAIARMKIMDTDSLHKSVSYKSSRAGDGHQGAIEIIFKEYGRMVDMGVGKGRGLQTNRDRRIEKLTVKGKRKPRKFYSKTAYGLITPLINDLQYGYTEEVKQKIKQSLENPFA